LGLRISLGIGSARVSFGLVLAVNISVEEQLYVGEGNTNFESGFIRGFLGTPACVTDLNQYSVNEYF